MQTTKTNNYIYLCFLIYIISLLISQLFSLDDSLFFLLITSLLSIALIAINEKFQLWRLKYTHYLLLITICFAGFFYFHFRAPKPPTTDISYYIKDGQFFSQDMTIEGKIINNPTINQKQKGRFFLQAESILPENKPSQKVTGKVYVTAPLLQVTGLYPSMKIRLNGNLYRPQQSFEPWGFDFADYLQRQGTFAGFSAQSIEIKEEGNLWSRSLSNWRQRIIKNHVRYLTVPQGNLLSSMVIGRREVDLSDYIETSFRQIGLSHVLSASGFHVSILLGLIMYLTRSWSTGKSAILVVIILFFYCGTTGFYPSILRASLMGLGGVIGLIYRRQVKSSAILLLVAVILLLINPLWIQDLSFQYSFLATWGLIITMPAIVDRLDWLPPTIANLIAVPVAATIWILPLQCYVFNYFSLYGILVNCITAPLILVIIIGGFIASFIGLIIPILGSTIAYGLWLPITFLITIVNFAKNLPLNTFAVGEISLIQLIIIYSVFFLICFHQFSQKYWHFLILTSLIIFTIPAIFYHNNLQQITILHGRYSPNMIIQNKRHNILININNKDNLNYDIVPFLLSQGINKLDTIVINDKQNNQQEKILLSLLSQTTKIKKINEFTSEFDIEFDGFNDRNIEFTLGNKQWLIVRNNQPSITNQFTQSDILIWFDRFLKKQDIQQINPQIIITNQKIDNPEIINYLSQQNIKLIITINKAIQWQPEKDFIIYQNT